MAERPNSNLYEEVRVVGVLGSSQEQQQQQQQQPHDQPGNDESPTNRPAAPMPANGYEAVRIVGVLGNSREQQRPQPARRQVRVPLANRQPSPLPFNSYEEMRVTTGLDNAPQQPSIPLAPPVENTDAPYSYIETTQNGPRPQRGTTVSETTSLLGRQRSHHQQLSQLEELTSFFLALLGIGRWYSGLGLFVSFLCFAAGVIFLVLPLVFDKDDSTDKLVVIMLTGAVFLLISLLWPLAWLCHRLNDHRNTRQCNYLLLFYGWLLSLFYAAVVGGLAVSVKDDYHCFPRCNYHDPKINQMPFWIFLTMWITLLLFGCVCIVHIMCAIRRRRAHSVTL